MIPKAAVEAAARSLYEFDGLKPWTGGHESTRRHYMRKARLALKAATPHMHIGDSA